jgi:hypothetical protein
MSEVSDKINATRRAPAAPSENEERRVDPEYLLHQAEMYRQLWEESQKEPVSPYSRIQTGLLEEKELVDQRQAALEEQNAAKVMDLDNRIDAVRKKDPSSLKPRPKRTPIGDRDVLKVDKRAGYHLRWVNDDQNRQRIQAFLDAGYGFVTEPVQIPADGESGRPTQMGERVSRSVGGGVQAYLMQIPIEFYREDQKKKAERVDRKEESIQTSANKVEGRYGDIVITRKT